MIIFTIPNCPACERVKAHVAATKYPCEIELLTTSDERAAALNELLAGTGDDFVDPKLATSFPKASLEVEGELQVLMSSTDIISYIDAMTS